MFLRMFYVLFFAMSSYCLFDGYRPPDPLTGLLWMMFTIAVAFTGTCVLVFLWKGIVLLVQGFHPSRW